MSEQNEQNNAADGSEAETTIVNTASVAAAGHGRHPGSGNASAQQADGTGDSIPAAHEDTSDAPADSADSSPLIPEPAPAPAGRQPADGADGREYDGARADDTGDDTGDRQPSAGSSVREKARSFAHSLGDLVGLTDAPADDAPRQDDRQDAQGPAHEPHDRIDGGDRRQTSGDGGAASPSPVRPPEEDVMDDGIQEDDDGSDARLTGRHPEFNNAFDIIDQMEGELEDARQVLFHASEVRVDQQSMLDHLSELRDVLPVQLERASALMREAEQRRQEASERSEKIVRAARDEKDRIIEDAHHRADVLAGQENVVALARQKAQAILKDANARARSLTKGADTYVEDVLTKLSEQLADFTKQTRGGITVLQQREEEAGRRFEQTRHEALDAGAAARAEASVTSQGVADAQNGHDRHDGHDQDGQHDE